MGQNILNVIIPKLNSDILMTDIDRCVDSVEHQIVSNWDIIPHVIDGESYPEIYNKAISNLAEGLMIFTYPCIVFKENAFSDILAEYINNKYDMALASFEKILWNSPQSSCINTLKYNSFDFSRFVYENSENELFTILWNKIFDIKLIQQNGLFFDERLSKGYETCFVLDYLMHCSLIASFDKILCQYRVAGSYELDAEARMFEKAQIYERYKEYELKYNTAVSEKHIIKYWQNYAIYEWVNASASDKEKLHVLKENIAFIPLMRSMLSPKRIAANIEVYKKQRQIIKAERLEHNKIVRLKNARAKSKKSFNDNVKRILLYCESSTMFPHIWDYYECIKTISNINISVYYQDNWSCEVRGKVTLIADERKAASTFWDLVVCADARIPFYFDCDETKIIYINHGLHMISYDKGESLYAYSGPLFSAMLEPNQNYVNRIMKSQNRWNNRVFHVGYKYYEQIKENINNYQEYRAALGIKADETVVAIFGSWGMDSLFHRVGNSLIEQAKALIEGKNYRFILSIHPKEYSCYDDNIIPLGDYIEGLRDEGFIVRNPKESSVSYLNAADIVITDYSTLCEEAMIAGKRIVLSEFPTERVWKYSTISDFQRKGTVFHNGDNLEDVLLRSKEGAEYELALKPPEGGYQNAVMQVTNGLLN